MKSTPRNLIQQLRDEPCAVSTPAQPALDRHLDELYKQFSGLEDRVNHLHARLDLSMRPSTPNAKEAGAEPMPDNHYCARVHTLRERTAVLASIIESTIDRLAV